MLDYKAWWSNKDSTNVEFTEDERETFLALKNREYLLTASDNNSVLMGLISLLYGYAYDMRFTEGDRSVESSWTIQVLSPVLSWCCNLEDVKSTGSLCFRRTLCYPLYRHFDVCCAVWTDVADILKLGVRSTLRALLQIRETLETADIAPYYLINRLYVDDYCVWLQQKSHVTDQKLYELSDEVRGTLVEKKDVGFMIEQLEQLAEEDESEESSAYEYSTASSSDDSNSEEEEESGGEEDDEQNYVVEPVSNSNSMKLRFSRDTAGSKDAPSPSNDIRPLIEELHDDAEEAERLVDKFDSVRPVSPLPSKSVRPLIVELPDTEESVAEKLADEISKVDLNSEP